MSNSVYKINKGINKSVEFKGLKAQYIWYLAGGVVGLLIAFAIMYIAGISAYICVPVVLIAGGGLFVWVYKLSNTYGEHGMLKKIAKKSIPDAIKSYSRSIFIK